MDWQGRRQSTNVEDRRKTSTVAGIGGGVGGLVVIGLLVFSLLTGTDTSQLVGLVEGIGTPSTEVTTGQLTEDEQLQLDYVETILADTEDVWTKIFKEQFNMVYEPPKLVLFTGYVQTGSGMASADMGPFYSPADKTVYMDLSFFEDMGNEYGAQIKDEIAGKSGDFVVAYVIAHEVGHHVQNLLGTSDAMYLRIEGKSEEVANEYSVCLELQADFYAGIFAYYDNKLNSAIEAGDIDAAVIAAEAIGDDTLQKNAQGYAQPDTFTHGTSAQRAEWFKKGYDTGDVTQGDTFKEILGVDLQ
ncbi:MAG: neutral zinc metallopeptidase [Coriobacteriales bacterium]|jgi:predicted metalloprotease|nr:neutral zinc metallopeptidase [Coriobacteriales bacterium]